MLIQAVAWCVLSLALAGFVQGALGFGFGMVAMALLPLAISVKEASPIVVLLTLPVVIAGFCVHGRHFRWHDGWMLIAGTCLGTPLGVYLLAVAPGEVLMRLLGGVLLLFAVQELSGARRVLALPRWTGIPAGVLGGALSGAFNSGGPPMVAYVYAQSWRKEKVVAVLQIAFAVGAALRLATMLRGGLFTAPVWHISLWAALPVCGTLLLGTQLLRRMPTEKLRSGVFLFIGAIALKYLIGG